MAVYFPPVYTHSVTGATGTVAAKTFLSVFNPATLPGGAPNPYTMIIFGSVVIPYLTAGSDATGSMEFWRTSAASGGTSVAAAEVQRFNTAHPDPVAEVRVGNPSATLVGSISLGGFPPAIDGAGAGNGGSGGYQSPAGATFLCFPGSGIAARVAVGNANQLFNVGISWAEVRK